MAERSNPTDVAAMDARIANFGDWRGEMLAGIRALIQETVPDVVETMKWKKPSNPAGVPVWERAGGGILCIGDAFKDKIKITFGRGAMLPDAARLFNASLNGNATRAIDLAKEDAVDPAAFKALVQAAAADQAAKRNEIPAPSVTAVAHARDATLALLAARPPETTVCPSHVARTLAGSANTEMAAEEWRDAMPAVHAAVDRLLAEGKVRLSWKGKALTARAGPYRIGRGMCGGSN